MARNVGVSIENAFNRGLITEVTGVNSPENSVSQTTNIVYDRRGRAVKRGAFDYEAEAVQRNIVTSTVLSEYLWKTISSNIGQEFAVVQIGSVLRFFSVKAQSALSSSLENFTVNLVTYKTTNFTAAQVTSTPASYGTGRGYLFVAHPYCDTIYIRYNAASNTITTTRINLHIRDLEGLAESIAVDTRPLTLGNNHKYNLYNQGWYSTVVDAKNDPGNALDRWDAARNDFPSNVDVWWYYTGVSESSSQLEFFNPSIIPSRTGLYGNTPAPRGHYIINAFQTDRSGLTGITGIAETSSGGLRPSSVSFYAGRVFYAGVGKSGFSSLIYFSQIIERDEQINRCYQSNDPTSREIFDLLDTDGGVIDIQDINTVYDLRVVGNALIVFASNGVWSISGTDNGAFKATDYSVTKITSNSAISALSIVDVSGSPVWWNYEGIFSLKNSESGLTTDVTSLSVATIQTFYDSIPQSSKTVAKGAFNNQANLVYWLYSSSEADPQAYDRILVLDAVSMAFYTFTIPTGTQKITGVLALRSSGALYSQDNLILNDLDPVIVPVSDPVYVQKYLGLRLSDMTFKFVTTSGVNLSFSEIFEDRYLDFGVLDYEASFVSGYRIRGELLKDSQTNYLTVIMDSIQNSSCFVQGVWDYGNSPNSGRYTNPQQVYMNKGDRDYQIRRIVMRGAGTALQFRFYGVAGCPMSIIGWAGFETANGAP